MALDITLDAAEMAIVPTGQDPATGDWVTATWIRFTTAPSQVITTNNRLTTDFWFAKVTATVDNSTDFAWLQVLVGPTGAITLPASPTVKVDVWSRVHHDNGEVPVQKHASVTIA